MVAYWLPEQPRMGANGSAIGYQNKREDFSKFFAPFALFAFFAF
jgi:hypothetical protein